MAYAIVMTDTQEGNVNHDGTQLKYHSSPWDTNVVKLCKTMASDTERVVRVLRCYKLLSKFAPQAGLRYDGL